MAGGGVKGGQSYGATDEFGGKVVDNKMHVHDFHATILRLMGFDHEKLIYNYTGRPFLLTDHSGNVAKELTA
jgi:arylsulfatase A-like enzyme